MISVEGLTFRYPGAGRNALEDVTLRLEAGSVTALMGSNGSGKSTLARCLNGLLQPTRGTVFVDGRDTSDPASLGAVRRSVGLVFQQPAQQMTSATVERELAFGLENLAIDPPVMRERVREALRACGLEHRATAPPADLSPGDQQRLAVAAVSLLSPGALVLDEATSLLSPSSRTAVLEMVLRRRGSAASLLLITQFPDEALLADRLIVLHGGRVALDGAPERLFRELSRDIMALGVAVPLRQRVSVPP